MDGHRLGGCLYWQEPGIFWALKRSPEGFRCLLMGRRACGP